MKPVASLVRVVKMNLKFCITGTICKSDFWDTLKLCFYGFIEFFMKKLEEMKMTIGPYLTWHPLKRCFNLRLKNSVIENAFLIIGWSEGETNDTSCLFSFLY